MRLSSSLVAFAFLGFAAAAAIPNAPPVHAPSLSTTVAVPSAPSQGVTKGIQARGLPNVGKPGTPSIPIPKPSVSVPGSAAALPVKVPRDVSRGDSVVGGVLGAANKVSEAAKGGVARRHGVGIPTPSPSVSTSLPTNSV